MPPAPATEEDYRADLAARARASGLDPELAEQVRAIRASACLDSLAEHTRQFWPVVEPGRELIWGKVHDAICLHLEALTDGRIKNLLINVPPGSSKSTIACVMWPSWMWARDPAWRGIFTSYSYSLSIRDSRRCRAVLRSARYRGLYRPPWRIVGDANAVSFYENGAAGWRMATTLGSGSTGHRGDATIVDDPHKASEVHSDLKREGVKEWYFEEFWNRLNSLEDGNRLVIMQRLHEDDLSGAILGRMGPFGPDNPDGWCHLMIPAEYEPERHCATPIGWEDWRQQPGELFEPIRFPRAVLDRELKALLEVGYAGQYQQRPAPAGGNLFRWELIRTAPFAPRILAAVRYWDKAGSVREGASWTAGVLVGVDDLGRYWILDVVRGRWSSTEREPIILAAARHDRLRGFPVRTWVEREPGSGGMESAEATVRLLSGHDISIDLVTGDKPTRARPLASQVAGGNAWCLEADWTEELIGEMKTFPNGRFKDQCDAAAGAYVKLAAWIEDEWSPGEALAGGADEYRAMTGEDWPLLGGGPRPATPY